jgi:uncharacterized protein (DUF1684 family)
MADSDYIREIEAWRAKYERGLAAEDGWLAIVDLAWLEEGDNTFGTGQDNSLILPEGSVSLQAGVLSRRGDAITLQATVGSPITLDGQPVTSAHIPIDEDGSSGLIGIGRLKAFVIRRGPHYGLRIYDPESPARRSFGGVRWFPVDRSYCIQARFVPASEPATLPVSNVMGLPIEATSPGYVTFELGGRALSLHPVASNPGERLFFMFRDPTNGVQTYPAGRYLYADPPDGGVVTLDFNKAYSPPCVFTPFATCMLPPEQNRLPLPIRAGAQADHA